MRSFELAKEGKTHICKDLWSGKQQASVRDADESMSRNINFSQ